MTISVDEFEDDQPFFDYDPDDDRPSPEEEEAVFGGEVFSSFSVAGETSFDAEASPTPARLLPGQSVQPLTSSFALPLPPPPRIASPYFAIPDSQKPISPAEASIINPLGHVLVGQPQGHDSDDKLWERLDDLPSSEIPGVENGEHNTNPSSTTPPDRFMPPHPALAGIPIYDEPTVTPEMLKQRQEMLKQGLTTNGVATVPVTRLNNPHHQSFFSFTAFNKVQSQVFEDVYEGDDNLVISAPTGSGKTTIFELAFLRTLLMYESNDHKRLCIYIAPTKALCSEKVKDWKDRMQNLQDTNGNSISCVEITGDSGTSFELYKKLKNAHLVITTPEKFDLMTRRTGKMAQELRDRLALIMIDELNCPNVRLVAVSATVPNIEDIARWLGRQQDPFELSHNFGENYRPVPLQRETYGIDGGGNEWQLGPKLDRELYPILVQHAKGKPVLVFCPTRNVFQAYEKSAFQGLRLPWSFNSRDMIDMGDSKLNELAARGIAVHHAGLDYDLRQKIEAGFREGRLQMIVSTSTLAVGVNLPAHTVIIKGTMTWHGAAAGFREYTDIEIQQMMGRAGRPQYDTSGTVIIMCDRSKVKKYQSMLRSETILESCLHRNLTEHINSEIGLGTIRSVSGAQQWLRR
ncbi:hypothetical protein IAT40_006002 [Kwoniella sp. CBS 6097]